MPSCTTSPRSNPTQEPTTSLHGSRHKKPAMCPHRNPQMSCTPVQRPHIPQYLLHLSWQPPSLSLQSRSVCVLAAKAAATPAAGSVTHIWPRLPAKVKAPGYPRGVTSHHLGCTLMLQNHGRNMCSQSPLLSFLFCSLSLLMLSFEFLLTMLPVSGALQLNTSGAHTLLQGRCRRHW
jgi:hypothetical protein